jgi:hypothetical protein
LEKSLTKYIVENKQVIMFGGARLIFDLYKQVDKHRIFLGTYNVFKVNPTVEECVEEYLRKRQQKQ